MKVIYLQHIPFTKHFSHTFSPLILNHFGVRLGTVNCFHGKDEKTKAQSY